VIIYPIVFILFLFLLIRYWKVFRLEGLSNWNLPAAFLIKFAIGLLLILIHIKTYGIGELSHDGETFLKEGKLLNDVFFRSPGDYFKLLTGIGETQELINEHLYMTEYWDAGDLTIINDSKNVIRVHSIIHFFSGNSLFIHLGLMCFLSTIAFRNIFITFQPYIEQNKTFLFWFLLLIPSTIFWTSSILKEPLMFLGLSFAVRAVFYNDQIVRKVIYGVLAVFMLSLFKPYILVCLVLTVLTTLVYKVIFKQRFILTALSLVIITLTAGYFLDKPRERVVHYLSRKQFDFVNVGKGGIHVLSDTCFYYFQPHQYKNLFIEGNKVLLLKGTDAYIIKFGSIEKPIPVHLEPEGKVWTSVYNAPGCASFIETTMIMDSPEQLLKNIPEALVNSLIRPFPSDPGSKLKFLAVIETWFILAFLLMAFFYRRTITQEHRTMIFSLGVFALLLLLLIGWTTPVLGAIARYRFPAQLALILIGSVIIKPLNFKPWKSLSS
jgi:hypothetical protein